ncbi:MAG TPA: cupin domain-containing protein [Solirubrobacteraceae bacterium]|nr:cupin domain-containing protein [Solirubrobacteraceae bacterium]
MRRVNLERAELSYDDDDPPGYAAAAVRLAGQLGTEELSINLFEVPPGQSLCPYHYEYVEEWLLILDGTATVRAPDGEVQLERGDLVRFPAGPEGAHKVSNRGEAPVRFIMFSSSREPAVAVYPDSDKVGVWTGNEGDDWMFHRGGAKVPYYEGEI